MKSKIILERQVSVGSIVKLSLELNTDHEISKLEELGTIIDTVKATAGEAIDSLLEESATQVAKNLIGID